VTRDRVRGRGRAGAAVALAGLLALLLLVPTSTPGQRIGLFFDPAATLCTREFASFDTVRVYVVGFPPADSLLGGALFSVEWPPLLEMWPGSFRIRREVVFDVRGDLDQLRDLDVRFRTCIQTNDPIPLVEFVVYEKSQTSRSDLRLRLIGVGIDSLLLNQPAWKICDPSDPEGFLDYLTAPSVDAVFNCSVRCYCTTAVRNATWSAIKSLYQGS